MNETTRVGRPDLPDPETIAAVVAALLTLHSAGSPDDEPASRWERRYRPDRPWAAKKPDWRARHNSVATD